MTAHKKSSECDNIQSQKQIKREQRGIYPRKGKSQMGSDNYQVTISLNDLWHLKSCADFGKYAQNEIDRLRIKNAALEQEILNYKTPQPPPVSK